MAENQEKKDRQPKGMARRNQPEQIESDNESLLDKHKDEQLTDPIPMDDLNKEMKEEKKKDKTKKDSGSEEKYKKDYK
ncbi:hypothetical protein SAMN05421743_103110 [Thalassobacillus cyri]|uniref:Uncharacterized protein n=1 Tax=Thalassobacillus cyri TaxID=571932 RepID=A0A1H3Z386_9BACI|nr:hypothetical protein [Thalassobacillus cyri]SEA18126.1 hypothetical protein SAMN05421743_103110 [Thalassobacillus cyri]